MNAKEGKQTPKHKDIGASTLRRRKHVAENRATAQCAKLDTQAEARTQQAAERMTADKPKGKQDQQRQHAHRRANTTIARAVEDYLQDHLGGNHSNKTLEWHRTALGLLQPTGCATRLRERKEWACDLA